MSAGSNLARVAYSPHVSNGAGGSGGFLVTWAEPFAPSLPVVFSQIVAYPNRVVGPAGGLADDFSLREIAYSPVSQVFLAAWETHNAPNSAFFRRVALNAQPIGAPVVLANGNAAQSWVIWNSITAIAWNSATNEFGILYGVQDGSTCTLRFARVPPRG
jgi:hypothetical protein